MRNKTAAATTTARLLENARYEVLPTATIEDKVLEHVPRDRTITVTASPSKGLEPTLDLAERLTGHGYVAVPHLAARMVRDQAELAEICDRLTGKGITRVFVPGGDADPPGAYPDALSLLEDLKALGSPFAHVGITGYPESHPTIDDDLTVQSMWDKRRYATHVVSNLTFDPAVLAHWVRRMRKRGITMPLLLGMPGPVDRTKLLGDGRPRSAWGSRRGSWPSTRARSPGSPRPAASPARGSWRSAPPSSRQPEMRRRGLHVFTFNQIAETEAWRRELLERSVEHRFVCGR